MTRRSPVSSAHEIQPLTMATAFIAYAPGWASLRLAWFFAASVLLPMNMGWPSLTVSQEDGFAALDFPGAAWASRQTLGERDDQSPAQGCDRVWDVAFGSDRGRLWVDDRREAQAPGGERRCRVWRGDESLAIPGLQNARARSLA